MVASGGSWTSEGAERTSGCVLLLGVTGDEKFDDSIDVGVVAEE
jgi:hypothetical protein